MFGAASSSERALGALGRIEHHGPRKALARTPSLGAALRWVLGEGGRATLSICGVPGSITNVGAGLAPGWPVAPPRISAPCPAAPTEATPHPAPGLGCPPPQAPRGAWVPAPEPSPGLGVTAPGRGRAAPPSPRARAGSRVLSTLGPSQRRGSCGRGQERAGAGDAAASSSGRSRDGRASLPPIPPRHRLRGGGAGDAVSGAAWRGFSTAVDPGWKPSSTVTEKARQGAATSKPRAWARTPGRLSRDRAARFAGRASLPNPGGMSRGRLTGTQDRADSAALDVRPR